MSASTFRRRLMNRWFKLIYYIYQYIKIHFDLKWVFFLSSVVRFFSAPRTFERPIAITEFCNLYVFMLNIFTTVLTDNCAAFITNDSETSSCFETRWLRFVILRSAVRTTPAGFETSSFVSAHPTEPSVDWIWSLFVFESYLFITERTFEFSHIIECCLIIIWQFPINKVALFIIINLRINFRWWQIVII